MSLKNLERYTEAHWAERKRLNDKLKQAGFGDKVKLNKDGAVFIRSGDYTSHDLIKILVILTLE